MKHTAILFVTTLIMGQLASASENYICTNDNNESYKIELYSAQQNSKDYAKVTNESIGPNFYEMSIQTNQNGRKIILTNLSLQFQTDQKLVLTIAPPQVLLVKKLIQPSGGYPGMLPIVSDIVFNCM